MASENGFPILDLLKEDPEYVSANLERLIREHGGITIMKGAEDHGVFYTADLADWEGVIETLNVIMSPGCEGLLDEEYMLGAISGEESLRRVYGDRYWEHPDIRHIKNLPLPAGVQRS